ncbi:hypothetical protein ACJJIW_02235 [Microbulbifer sp. JMSA004]|uniref:hypothetical protein n=1 Tax=Microbulbifer sp. JMSA004 TaxID=3243370 RepID=UPI004039A23B
MNQLKVILLWACMGVLLFLGTVFYGMPFFLSFGINNRAENDSTYAFDLSDMKKGEYREYGYFSVYRRTDRDKLLINEYLGSLQDPSSLGSSQPEGSDNVWRSGSENFFVFYPYAPNRGCSVDFVEPNHEPYGEWMNASHIHKFAHFVDLCEGRIWDTSGRILKKPYSLPEVNLTVPKTKWYTSAEVVVVLGS